MQEQIATWNTARNVWQRPPAGKDTPCGHLELYSETWPSAGMTRNGQASKLPMWERPINASASSSLLPTVTTQDAANTGGPSQFKRNTPPLNTQVLMLPTPTVGNATGGNATRSGTRGAEKLLPGLVKDFSPTPLLRTPCAAEAEGGPQSPAMAKLRGQTLRLTGQIIDLINPGQLPQPKLLPTPEAKLGTSGTDYARASRKGSGGNDLQTTVALSLLPTPKLLLPTPMTAYTSRNAETFLNQRRAGNGERRTVICDLRIVVEEVIPTGDSTKQPSADGSSSSDAQPQPQPSRPAATAITDSRRL